MRILWVKTDFLHPTTRGGQIRSLEILKRLHARHEIDYVAFDDTQDGEGPRRSAEYCARPFPLRHATARKGTPAFAGEVALGLFSSLPVTLRRWRSGPMRRRIRSLLSARRYDRLVCDFLAPAPNLPELSRWVLFQHNVESEIWRRRADRAPDPARRLYLRLQENRMRRFEGRACREAGRVVAVSRRDADTLRTLYGATRVSVIPTGVDVERFTPPGAAPRAADLVFVGSMDWFPNVDGVSYFVREILARIRARRPGCTLAIVGRSPGWSIRALAAGDPGILVTGTVDDVRPYLWGSGVSIVPLRIGGGTRLKIYEAIAAGVPVVSTTIGAEGLDEVSSPKTIRLADDSQAFADACVELLEDREARARQAAAGLALVRSRCSWEAAARVFEEILERCPPAGAGAGPDGFQPDAGMPAGRDGEEGAIVATASRTIRSMAETASSHE